MARIFLSHSVENNAEAIAVWDWLKSQGWDDVFLDLDPERGLKAGERWQAALKRAAERCELVIFLISPDWAASKWCLAEFLLAKSLNKRIFGVLIEPTPFTDLPTEMTSEYQLVDITAGARDHQVTVTVPPENTTTTVALAHDGLKRLRIGLMRAGLDARYFAWPPDSDPNRPPYGGLRPLGADDAGIFFGRDGPIVEALDRLRGLREAPPPRLLVILGASGAGKSSLLRAGLLPRLLRDHRHFLALPIIRPEHAVITGETGLLSALEGAFRVANVGVARADLRASIGVGAEELKPLLAKLANASTSSASDQTPEPQPPTLVLSVDQAEELFLSEGQDESLTFLTIVRDLVVSDTPPVIALLTIRSDNYERLQQAKELEGIHQQTLSLPPMPKGSYAEVIKGPARRLEGTARALKIEDRLVDALLADIEAGGAKDALPLLAFTLERLYGEYGAGGELRLSHYEQLGRVKGSIEAAVKRAFKAADADSKIPRDRNARLALLRRGLIPWLAGIDPDSGAPRRRVARLSEIPLEVRPLIDLLVQQRLLSTDVAKDTGEKTIEPAHEALLRQWGLLQGWLAQDTGLLGVLDGIKRASRDWAANANETTWLTHREDRLSSAEKLRERTDLSGNLEPTDWNYLDACRKAERTRRARARRGMSLTVGLVLVIVAVGIAWLNQATIKEEYNLVVNVRPFVLSAEKEDSIKPGDEFAECYSVCPEMVVVPPGEFLMGTVRDGRGGLEEPQHSVTIAKPLSVSKFEITFDQWEACVDSGGCRNPASDNGWGRATRPAINISWSDAKEYVAWLSKLTNRPYRLLSEAEWEYAARAGSKTEYSFGDARLFDYGWYSDNSGGKSHPVGEKRANAFGLFDMHGNVQEWVEDCYDHGYSRAPWDGSARTKANCDSHVARGGSWYDYSGILRSAAREFHGDSLYNYVGFRVARTLHP